MSIQFTLVSVVVLIKMSRCRFTRLVLSTDSDSSTPDKIAKDYPKLSLGLDGISTSETMQLATKALSNTSSGSDRKLVVLLPPAKDIADKLPSNVNIHHTLVYTLLGHEFDMGKHFDASPEDRKELEEWLQVLPQLLQDGRLKSNPVWKQDGGLAKIDEHMNLVKDGKVRKHFFTHGIRRAERLTCRVLTFFAEFGAEGCRAFLEVFTERNENLAR